MTPVTHLASQGFSIHFAPHVNWNPLASKDVPKMDNFFFIMCYCVVKQLWTLTFLFWWSFLHLRRRIFAFSLLFVLVTLHSRIFAKDPWHCEGDEMHACLIICKHYLLHCIILYKLKTLKILFHSRSHMRHKSTNMKQNLNI